MTTESQRISTALAASAAPLLPDAFGAFAGETADVSSVGKDRHTLTEIKLRASDEMMTGPYGGQDFDWPGAAFMVLPDIVLVTQRHYPSRVTTVTGPSDVTVFPDTLDTTEYSGDDMAALAIAAEEGDEATFLQIANQIDWLERPAVDFAHAVRLALAAGAHLFARNLAARGARLHPDHSELQKMARILAPPRTVRANLPPDPSVRPNIEWLRTHAAEYRGRWVALQSGALVASSPTARGLREKLATTKGLFVTRVV